MGFCLINNAAVAARHAQRLGYARVMIADFDVHHGNGTQAAFYDDDTVFYFSTHEYPHYPGTGAAGERGAGQGTGFTRNIPLRAGAGDAEMRAGLPRGLPRGGGRLPPRLLHRLGRLRPARGRSARRPRRERRGGARRSCARILDACAGIPVVCTLEGGYHLATLARCVGHHRSRSSCAEPAGSPPRFAPHAVRML